MLPKILIVDDLDTNILLLSKALGKTNAELIALEDPREALKISETQEFALMILDIQMPKISGFELAEKIKEGTTNKNTPIIFLTGIFFDNDSIFQGYLAGAVDYLIKPIKSKILLSKVNIFLKLYNQRIELEKRKTELEEKVLALQKAEEKIIKSVIEGEDNERKRIARELHDGIGQYLTASSLNFNSIKDAVNKLDKKKIDQYNNGLDFLHKAIKEAREMSHNLMPKEIDDFGLIISLESLIEKLNDGSGIEIKLLHNFDDNNNTDKNTEVNIYRITQELLNNSIKHSKATEITIQFVQHKNELIFTFEDNGCGFNPEKETHSNSSFGLKNIVNRCKSLGAEIEISSKKDKGSSVLIEIPT